MKLYPTVVDEYLRHPTCTIRAESSRRSMRMTVRLFQNDHPGLEIQEVSPEHIQNWLGQKRIDGVSDSTLKKYLQRLRSLMSWCAWRGIIAKNPTEHIEKVLMLHPQPVKQHRWLNIDQSRALLDSLEITDLRSHRDALVIGLGLTAGLRNNEIRTLPLSALEEIASQKLTVRGKGGKLAQVHVMPRTAEWLISWLEKYENPLPHHPVIIAFKDQYDFRTKTRTLVPRWGVGISQQAVGKIVAQRSAAAGLKVSPHDLRRAYAWMMEQKVGVVKASHALRHSHISTTQIYLERRQDSAYLAGLDAGIDL